MGGKGLDGRLALTEEPTARELLAGRLELLGDNIYVQASRGTVARPTDYSLVEGRLGVSLAILHQRIAAEALNRNVAVQETARTLDSIQAAEELRRRIEAGDSLLLDSLRLDSLRRDSLRRNAPGANPADAFFAPILSRRRTPPGRKTRSPEETPFFGETPWGPSAQRPGRDGPRRTMTEVSVHLEQELFGARFQNPVMLAAGTCGFGRELAGVIELDRLGGFVTKSVTLQPRAGNPEPRVSEGGGVMINSVGLANPGVERVRAEQLPWLASRLRRAQVFVSVAGHAVAEYCEIVERLDAEEGFLGFELNLSCPNVPLNGMPFALDPDMLATVVSRVRKKPPARCW